MTDYFSAEDAAAALEIRVDTLYAYVSRGLIRSEPATDGTRAKRYLAEDVFRLQRRQSARRNPAQAAEPPLTWGFPVFDSAITLLDGNRICYRGHEVTDLAASHSIEEVAGLLWSSNLHHPIELPELTTDGIEFQADLVRLLPSHQTDPIPGFQLLVNWLGSGDLTAYDFRPESVISKGATMLRHLAYRVSAGNTDNIASSLQRAWAADNPEAERMLNGALILCADHELNASSFTVRCIASTRAPVHAAVSGGMSALMGARHGGASLAVEALFDEVERSDGPAQVISQRLRRGEPLPGFGHRLYPDGDPRAEALLELCGPSATVDRLAQAGLELTGLHPNLEFGLVSLARSIEAPPGAALTIMSIGRTVGWIAHALEEYQRNEMIRPRARYIGPPPIDQDATTG